MEPNTASRVPAGVRSTALGLAVDTVTAEVVTAMRDAGVRPLLLKGPSIATWLYGDDAPRPYGDSDLLVAPESYGPAEEVLRELGFRPLAYPWPWESETWVRRFDQAAVDLHCSLVGAAAAPATVWEELAADAETLHVGGVDVEVLGIRAKALQIALHAAQHGAEEQPLEDLARALRIADEQVWSEAGDLARRVDAVAAFATGLRLDPEGALLARRLTLPAESPPEVALRAQFVVPFSIALERLRSGPLRARVHLFLRALVPSPLYMRNWSRMQMSRWPAVARRGRLGLWLAYLWRPIWLLLRVPRAITAVRRAATSRSKSER